jgi:Fe-S-cluster containining protein
MGRKRKHNVIFPRIMFSCKGCGKCCVEDNRSGRRIVLTERDALEISGVTGIRLSEFTEENSSEAYPYVMRLVYRRCFFLGPDNKCRIYSARPLVCRFYPFLMQKVGRTYVFHADPLCPGLGEGMHLDEEYFEKLVEEAEKRLNMSARRFGARRS